MVHLQHTAEANITWNRIIYKRGLSRKLSPKDNTWTVNIELNYAHKECKVTSSGKTGKNEKGIQRSAIYGRENLRIHTLLPEFTHWRLGGCDANQHCFFRPHHRVTELQTERGYWPFVRFCLSENAIVLILCLNSIESIREGLKNPSFFRTLSNIGGGGIGVLHFLIVCLQHADLVHSPKKPRIVLTPSLIQFFCFGCW